MLVHPYISRNLRGSLDKKTNVHATHNSRLPTAPKLVHNLVHTKQSLGSKYTQLKARLVPLGIDTTELDAWFSEEINNPTEKSTTICTTSIEPGDSAKTDNNEHSAISRTITLNTNMNSSLIAPSTYTVSKVALKIEKKDKLNQNSSHTSCTTSYTQVHPSKNPDLAYTHLTPTLTLKRTEITQNIMMTSTSSATDSVVAPAKTEKKDENKSTTSPSLNMKFRPRTKKSKIFAQIDTILQRQQQNINRTKSYSDIVRAHSPNVIAPIPIISAPLYKEVYKRPSKKELYKLKHRKLCKTGGKTSRIYIGSNNDNNNRLSSMTMTDSTITSNSNDEEWQLVKGSKKAPFQKALPKTHLVPIVPYTATSPPRHTYCITLGLTPASDIAEPVIITPRLIGKVLSSLQYVSNNTILLPMDDDLSPQSDPAILHDMEDSDIVKYVYVVPNMNDSYRCSFKISSDATINEFKLNTHLMKWLQNERIQIDRTYLLGQPSTKLGFMVLSSTRGDIVNLLDQRIRGKCKPHLKWQFDINSAWVRSKSNTSAKVIMIRAPKLIESELIHEFHERFNYGRTIQFYPWNEFLELSDQQKDQILNEQNAFQEKYRTVVFTGFKDFTRNTMVFSSDEKPNDSQKRKFLDPINEDDSTDIDMNIALPNGPSTMTVLDAIRTQFINGKGEQLFYRVHRPINGILECTVTKQLFFQAKKIPNERFLNSLSTIIPTNRHALVFSDPASITSTGQVPSKLLHNKIYEWIKHTPVKDTPQIETQKPRQRQRTSSKLLVFQGYSQAVSLLSNQNKKTQPTANSNPEPAPTVTVNHIPPEKSPTEFHTIIDVLNKKVDNKFISLEKRLQDDRVAIATMQGQVKRLETNVNTTNTSISNMESKLLTNIETTVQTHMKAYAKTFEEQLNEKLLSTASLLDQKNEERTAMFRSEHHAFRSEFHAAQEEQRKVNTELQAMLRQILISSGSEITFSPESPSDHSNEDINDVSFTNYHE
jgi:hypothetical protein